MDPIRYIEDKTSIALRMQNATGFAQPAIIPFRDTVVVKKGESIYANKDLVGRLSSGLKAIAAVNYQMPVGLRLDTDAEAFTLPVDPIISLSGKNIITRRYVAKSQKAGTIKERWSQDDWEITISGLLTSDDLYDVTYYTEKLRKICEEGKTGVSIECEILNSAMNIQRFAIERFDFPFTKGMENQNFVIKGYSDDVYDLLVK